MLTSYSNVIILHCLLRFCCVLSRLLNTNPLNQWFKPTDYGSTTLIDTSSFIDPYRSDSDISRFRPFIDGYVSTTIPTSIITTQSFEECMEQCIQDSNCKAFEINMLILPFRCKISVKPCPDGSCSEFISHPHWKHFVRDDNNTQTTSSTISLDTLDGKYRSKKIHQVHGFSVEILLNNSLFDYIEIEVLDASPDSIAIDYIWFEYKTTSTSNWLKCERVQLPQIATTYHIPNKCIKYDFHPNVQSKCNVLKESWEYHPITTQTTKIGNVYLEDPMAVLNAGISLQTCSDNLVRDTTRNAEIYYDKLGPVHAVRLFSTIGKFVIHRIEAKILQQTPGITAPVTHKISQFGDTNFKHPPNTTVLSSDPRNTVDEWYYNILKDGGYLWCRNPVNSANANIAVNVFKQTYASYVLLPWINII